MFQFGNVRRNTGVRMKHHPNFYFESLTGDHPAVSSSQVLRGVAAGSQLDRGEAVTRRTVNALTAGSNPADPASQYRFGAGPSRASPPLDRSAYQFLERSQIAQAAIDVFALSFLLFFVFLAALAIVGSVASFVLVLI